MFDDWFRIPDGVGVLVYLVGWGAGWVACRGVQRLAAAAVVRTSAVSVVVPCRNEAVNLRELLPNLKAVLRDDDEIIVVDDNSSDATATYAATSGVIVLTSSALPSGWAGKPHACWQGALLATKDVVVFLDADVRLGPSAIDDLVSLLDSHPDAVVSAMPWHRTGAVVERVSMLFNTVSMMVARFATDKRRRIAYGPFLAVRREQYLRVGGHAHAEVRGAVVEDLALARVMPAAVARLAGPRQVEYRMYPLGLRQIVDGWTKNTAIGAVQTPRLSALLIVVWVASLCGGALTSVWWYLFSLVQVRVLAKRVGNFGWGSAVLYPLHAAVFVAVALRSVVRSALVGNVVWRGRTVATR